MKFSNLPVLGEREWFNHTIKSLQEAGSTVTIDPVNYDYVLGNGASRPNGDNDLYVYRVTMTDGVHTMHLIGGVGYVHHGALNGGQKFTIKLPWQFGRGSAIDGSVFDTWNANLQLEDNGQTVDVYSLSDGTHESTNWINFKIFSPF